MKKVLVVEDNQDLAKILGKRLRKRFYEVAVVNNGMDVISRLMKKEEMPDAVILDMMVPARSGFELLSSIKNVWPKTKVYVFSAYSEYARQIPKSFIEGFFLKTDGIDVLIEALEKKLDFNIS